MNRCDMWLNKKSAAKTQLLWIFRILTQCVAVLDHIIFLHYRQWCLPYTKNFTFMSWRWLKVFIVGLLYWIALDCEGHLKNLRNRQKSCDIKPTFFRHNFDFAVQSWHVAILSPRNVWICSFCSLWLRQNQQNIYSVSVIMKINKGHFVLESVCVKTNTEPLSNKPYLICLYAFSSING